jgi:ornithine carbamoyltransferase
MYIKKRNNLRILEQRKKELEQLAIKSAQRLREKKANNTVNIYKKKLVESIDKKRVNYGFLIFFPKRLR